MFRKHTERHLCKNLTFLYFIYRNGAPKNMSSLYSRPTCLRRGTYTMCVYIYNILPVNMIRWHGKLGSKFLNIPFIKVTYPLVSGRWAGGGLGCVLGGQTYRRGGVQP